MKNSFKIFSLTFLVAIIASLGFGSYAFAADGGLFNSSNEVWGWIAVGVGGVVLFGSLVSVLVVLIVYGLFKLIFGSKKRGQKRREEEHQKYLADKAKKEAKKYKKLEKKGELPEQSEVAPVAFDEGGKIDAAKSGGQPLPTPAAAYQQRQPQADTNKFFIPLVTEPVEELPVLDMCALDDGLNAEEKAKTLPAKAETIVDGLAVPELPSIDEAAFVVKKAKNTAVIEEQLAVAPIPEEAENTAAAVIEEQPLAQKPADEKPIVDLFAPIDINSVLDEPILPLDPKDVPLGSEEELLPVFTLPDEELLDSSVANENDMLLSDTAEPIAAASEVDAEGEFEIIPPTFSEESDTTAVEDAASVDFATKPLPDENAMESVDGAKTAEESIIKPDMEQSDAAAVEITEAPVETPKEEGKAIVEGEAVADNAVVAEAAVEVETVEEKPAAKKTATKTKPAAKKTAEAKQEPIKDVETAKDSVADNKAEELIKEVENQPKAEEKPTPKKDIYNIPLEALKPKVAPPAQKATSIEEALAFLNNTPDKRR